MKPLAAKTRLIGLLFADQDADISLISHLATAGFKGVMLDTAMKDGSRLINHLDIPHLQQFVGLAHASGLIAGLAGSLEAPDIARLLPIGPDLLGFRGALTGGKGRATHIDAAHVRLIRDLIPRETNAADLGDEFKVDWRLLSARGYAPGRDLEVETDRVFVHNLILPVSIGGL